MTEGAFHLQPTLTGELLELRPLRGADFDALFAAASDPLIWEQHPENDRYTREVFQKYFDGAIESGGAFAIIERKSGRIIGSSRYCHLYVPGKCFSSSPHLNPLPQGEEDATAPGEGSPSRRIEVEIGWTFLERAFWGGRYNRELKTLMLAHAFGIVDSSVMPYVTNGNIYAPVMMVAEKAADLILGNTPLPPQRVRFHRHQRVLEK